MPSSRKPKSSKKKSDSVARLKKQFWPIFSQYIRQRDSDWKGEAVCVTCGCKKPWQALQAGHFIPGRHNSIIYDERNVHAQCYQCNIALHGNTLKYYRFMQSRYGDDVIAELEALDRQFRQFTAEELKALIRHYKQKLK